MHTELPTLLLEQRGAAAENARTRHCFGGVAGMSVFSRIVNPVALSAAWLRIRTTTLGALQHSTDHSRRPCARATAHNTNNTPNLGTAQVDPKTNIRAPRYAAVNIQPS